MPERPGDALVSNGAGPAMATPTLVTDLKAAFERARDFDGSMNERLATFARDARRLNPSFAVIVDRFVSRLKQHGAGDAAPKPGETMPPFVLPDENGHLLRLQDLLRHGPAIVTFNRGHWCPYCRISINTLAKAQPCIDALGARMVAIVPESGPFAAEMKFDSNVKFPILSDMDNGYALSLNLAVWIDGEMKGNLQEIGRDLPRYQGNESWMLPIPATFVVGQDGRVKARFIDPDYRKRVAVEDLIDALK
jgi:peroxiredoxin